MKTSKFIQIFFTATIILLAINIRLSGQIQVRSGYTITFIQINNYKPEINCDKENSKAEIKKVEGTKNINKPLKKSNQLILKTKAEEVIYLPPWVARNRYVVWPFSSNNWGRSNLPYLDKYCGAGGC